LKVEIAERSLDGAEHQPPSDVALSETGMIYLCFAERSRLDRGPFPLDTLRRPLAVS
jgi:hypothetical protein